MSTRAAILSLAATLGNGQADPVTLAGYLGDILTEMNSQPWLTTASILPVARGQGSFVPPDSYVRTLGVAYDDRWLSLATLRELEWSDPGWRARSGVPLVYVREGETTQTFRMFPVPDQASGDLSFFAGAPMGVDYPASAVLLVHTETRDTVPDWLDLPLALAVLERDFARESAYRDPVFSAACGKLAAMLLAWVR